MWRLPGLLLVMVAVLGSRPSRAEDSVTASIVNGYNAPKNRYPWVVSLRTDIGKGEWHFCGGVLIQESVVMTAASCVRDALTGQNLPPEYYYPLVRIGGYYRMGDPPGSYQQRKVVRTVIYPKFVTGYVDDNSNNDLALLLLDKPSTKTPIKLPPYTAKPKLPLPKMSGLLSVGWGWTNPNVPSESEKLQQINMLLLSLAQCQKDWGTDVLIDKSTTPPTRHTVHSNFRTNNMLCSAAAAGWPKPNGGPCWGDGGVPFFRRGATAAGDTIYGVLSYGPEKCGRGSYVITDVAALQPWINVTVQGLTRTEWDGRVWGDPNVLGFDGSQFQTTTPAGQSLTILNSTGSSMKLVAFLGTHFRFPNLTVMTHVDFNWGAKVVMGLWNDKTYVTVNGVTLLPGRAVAIPGGRVRYRENLKQWSQQVTIEQPGMGIRINRVWDRRRKVFLPWFDIWVFLTRRPKFQLGGVLGSTFPEVFTSAAGGSGATDLVAGLVLPSVSTSTRR